MRLTLGAHIGPYEIVAPLGRGGMGDVYRAHDTRLSRDVAIKALPAEFATDGERLARFEREAKLLASLNHPHIAGIHGIEEAGGARYLVLEFVDGETLAARLQRGALPLDEALEIAAQVAAALEAAHDAGIVHRDLKPANVMVRPDGVVKVLDLGLAKGRPATENVVDLTQSPTVTSPATMPGVVLGSAAYMSPEQARGRSVDRRADVWAWGCLLYECLSGRRAFGGDDLSETMAAILRDAPDWTALPAGTPPRVRDLLARCLVKDPRERQRDLGDARLELLRVHEADGAAEPVAGGLVARGWPTGVALGLLATGLLVGAIGGAWYLRLSQGAPTVTRLSILPPDAGTTPIEGGDFALSPDGRTLALSALDAQGVRRLWLRGLAEPDARPVAGTTDAQAPFWSPDGSTIAFFAQGQLRRVDASGGEVRDLCAANAARGGTWGARDRIVFCSEPVGPLMMVGAAGGIPIPIRHRDLKFERYPRFLDDGVHYLFIANRGSSMDRDLFLGAIDDSLARLVIGNVVSFDVTGGNRVLFVRQKSLFIQRLDVGSARVIGGPKELGEHISLEARVDRAPLVSASREGTLVYGQRDERTTDLAWFDRSGRLQRTLDLGSAEISTGSLSADGRHLVVAPSDPIPLVSVELERGDRVPLPGTETSSGQMAWSPDGRRVLTDAHDRGAITLVAVDASGNGRIDSILVSRLPTAEITYVRDWSADGRTVIVGMSQPATRWDILRLTVGSRGFENLVATPAMEGDARLSHGGRALAYTSDQSGRAELYLEEMSDPGHPVRVSHAGVHTGAGFERCLWWRDDDRELYFLGADRRTLYACDVSLSPVLHVAEPHVLFVGPPGTLGVEAFRDGQRFLVFLPHGEFAHTLTVVQHAL